MEESGIIAAKANPSFEILSSSEEEDFVSINMQDSMLLGSLSEITNSYFSVKSVATDAEDKNLPTKSGAVTEGSFCSSSDMPFIDLREDHPQKPEEVLKPEPAVENAVKIERSTTECKMDSCTAVNIGTCRFVESISTSGTDAQAANRCPSVGREENFFRRESPADLRRDAEKSTVADDPGCSEGNQEQRNFSNGKFLQPQNNSDHTFAKSAVDRSRPNRNNCPEKLRSVVKQTFNLRRWFQSNTCLHSMVSGARASFFSFLNTVELQMNLLMGMEPLKVLIIADAKDANAIRESFSRALSGQVVISRRPVVEDHAVPPLPVGHDSALQLAQSQTSNARRRYDSETSTSVIVTAVKFIEEIHPQRWQLLTALWLEDPNLALNLHNFTTTIPVPNDYVNCARELTPDKYPFKESGLAATLEEAIGCATKIEVPKDAEEIMCGINHLVHLKSASDVLAGMYYRYVNKFSP